MHIHATTLELSLPHLTTDHGHPPQAGPLEPPLYTRWALAPRLICLWLQNVFKAAFHVSVQSNPCSFPYASWGMYNA